MQRRRSWVASLFTLVFLLGCSSAGTIEDASDAAEPDTGAPADDAADAAFETSASMDAADGAPSDSGVADVAMDSGHPAGWVQTIVATGYGGVRIVSIDAGKTWTKVAQLSVDGGDDAQLLRTITYGKGTWVAAGWRFFTSADARHWTEGKNPDGCNVLESVCFGNDVFVAACGGHSYVSSDGKTYEKAADINTSTGHVRVYFAKGMFAASGDDKKVFSSKDAKSWTPEPSLTGISVCDDTFKSEGACGDGEQSPYGGYLKPQWKGQIQRSDDQKTWKTVYTDDSQNSPGWFAYGWAPPP